MTASFDPAFPADLDLDVAVWAAYNAAYTLAIADGDYLFIRNGDFGIVRKAILAELEKEGLAGIDIVTSPIAEAAAAFGCADPGTTAMRVAFTAGGLGITIVAASSQRMSAYEYDPDASADLRITYARDCQTSGFGRMRSANVE